MGRFEKLMNKILSGRSDSNLKFSELCNLLLNLGFTLRTKGSHCIFFKKDVDEIINLQEKGGLSKPYQVKQVRDIILKYNLNIKE